MHLSMPAFSIPAHVSTNTFPFFSITHQWFHLTVGFSHNPAIIMTQPKLLVDGYHADSVWNHESAFPWIEVMCFFQRTELPLWPKHQVLSGAPIKWCLWYSSSTLANRRNTKVVFYAISVCEAWRNREIKEPLFM